MVLVIPPVGSECTNEKLFETGGVCFESMDARLSRRGVFVTVEANWLGNCLDHRASHECTPMIRGYWEDMPGDKGFTEGIQLMR
jgi:hypothetical protein